MKPKFSLNFILQYMTTAFMWLLIVVTLNMLNQKPDNALSYGIIVLLMLAAYYFFFRNKGRRLIYIMFPIAAIAMWLLDYHWTAVLIGAFLPIVKLEYLHHDEQTSRLEISMMISFIIVMTLNFISFSVIEDYMMWLYLIVIAQIIFYFIGRFLVLMYKNGREFSDNLKIFIVGILSFVSLGLLLGFSFRYVIQYGTYVILFLLNGFIVLLRPIFAGLENVELDYPQSEEEPEELGEDQQEEEVTQATGELPIDLPIELITVVALIVIVIITLVIYFKRRGDLSKKDSGEKDTRNMVQHVEPRETKYRFKDYETPDDKVRKVYFEFEKWLAKNDIGRYHNETISDWLKRHDFVSIIQSEDFDTYRKVRYYGERVDEAEFKQFVKCIDEIKTAITETHLKSTD